jgi:hypothetical protein
MVNDSVPDCSSLYACGTNTPKLKRLRFFTDEARYGYRM